MRWLLLIGSVALAFGVGVAMKRQSARRLARRRLVDLGVDDESEPLGSGTPSWRRFRWLAPLPAAIVLGLLLWFGWPWPLAAAFAFLAFVLALQAEATWAERRERVVENQLSEALDMMVASVKAGAALPAALESARTAVGQPLRHHLDVLIGRVRYGDDPQDALFELSDRVPLETVRLFSQALAVNWSVGGKLSDTLANVGRTVRDRAELTRRTQAMSTQARLSVVVIIGVTYFIAALMWRNDPPRFVSFLTSTAGKAATSIAIAAQALGTLWVAQLSRPRF